MQNIVYNGPKTIIYTSSQLNSALKTDLQGNT